MRWQIPGDGVSEGINPVAAGDTEMTIGMYAKWTKQSGQSSGGDRLVALPPGRPRAVVLLRQLLQQFLRGNDGRREVSDDGRHILQEFDHDVLVFHGAGQDDG